jgi:hypothetical protein
MFKFLMIIFISSIALANSNNFMEELHRRISEIEIGEITDLILKSEKLAINIMTLRNDILATHQRFMTYAMSNDILTKDELAETTQYVIALVEKASQIMQKEYLTIPHYTEENFKETYIEFHKMIYKYMGVIFIIPQRLLEFKKLFSLEDYHQFIESIEDRTEPHNLSLEETHLMKAITECQYFTNFLADRRCSVLHVIKVVLLDKDNIAQYLKVMSLLENYSQTP